MKRTAEDRLLRRADHAGKLADVLRVARRVCELAANPHASGPDVHAEIDDLRTALRRLEDEVY